MWGGYRRGYSRGWNWMPLVAIVLIIAFFSGGHNSWMMWVVLWVVVVPFLRNVFSSGGRRRDDYEKRKHESGDVIIVDKPKREPHYAVGDDGELVEVYDDEVYDEKPKR